MREDSPVNHYVLLSTRKATYLLMYQKSNIFFWNTDFENLLEDDAHHKLVSEVLYCDKFDYHITHNCFSDKTRKAKVRPPFNHLNKMLISNSKTVLMNSWPLCKKYNHGEHIRYEFKLWVGSGSNHAKKLQPMYIRYVYQ